MRACARFILTLSFVVLAGCQSAPKLPATPAPAACQLAGFGVAPGLELVKPRRPGADANAIPLDRSVADTGAWVDAAPGWRAWRYWLRSETARSVSVHLQPFSLPAGAEFWLCSPDRTTRQGPIGGQGLGGVGQYRSPEVPGPELWLEVLAPAGSEKEVSVVIAEAFAVAP